MAFNLPVGYKFAPNDEELVGYYLFNKLFAKTGTYFQNPFVKDCNDLYGDESEVWDIWNRNGGDNLEDDHDALYFFTERKNKFFGSRICRKIGSGTWAGEDSADMIEVGNNVVGSKKRFRYENYDDRYSNYNGAWIMHEFAIVRPKPACPSKDVVLCRIKKNLRGPKKKRKLEDADFKQPKRCCKIIIPNCLQRFSHNPNLTEAFSNILEPEALDRSNGDDALWTDIYNWLPPVPDLTDSEIAVAHEHNMLQPLDKSNGAEDLWKDVYNCLPPLPDLIDSDIADGTHEHSMLQPNGNDDALWKDTENYQPPWLDLDVGVMADFWNFED